MDTVSSFASVSQETKQYTLAKQVKPLITTTTALKTQILPESLHNLIKNVCEGRPLISLHPEMTQESVEKIKER